MNYSDYVNSNAFHICGGMGGLISYSVTPINIVGAKVLGLECLGNYKYNWHPGTIIEIPEKTPWMAKVQYEAGNIETEYFTQLHPQKDNDVYTIWKEQYPDGENC